MPNWYKTKKQVSEEKAQQEIEEKKRQLEDLDRQAIRPMRAILAEQIDETMKAEQKDKDKLKDIEKQVKKLRKELRELDTQEEKDDEL